MNAESVIEVHNISKYFGQFCAIEDVSFAVPRGRTLGLVGDNGAGKSTIIKVLSGVYQPNGGEIRFEGKPVRLLSPMHARKLGIETVFQDLALVNQLSIARNFFMGAELTRRIGPLSVLDAQEMNRRASDYIREIGITRLEDAGKEVQFLSGGERQAIAIARAMYFGAKLIILDEPTSALSIKEARKVLNYVEVANERGISVIIISHNIHHILPISHQIAVIYHGRLLTTVNRGDHNATEIENLIMHGVPVLEEAMEGV